MDSQYSLIATINSDTSINQVESLFQLENDENNTLIQILGVIRPAKSSQTSITSVVRGLFTKNKSLLKVLESFADKFNHTNDVNDDKQIFKAFINEFILWSEDDVLLLFSKYSECLKSLTDDYHDINQFKKPVIHLLNYVEFIDNALLVLRNPYISDKLTQFKLGCQQVVDNLEYYLEVTRLNRVDFHNVQTFGTTDVDHKVCSYFKMSQIVTRSKSTKLSLESATFGKHYIELLLLDLINDNASDDFNALAIVSVPRDGSPRSLMFPPFRVNELFLSFSNSKRQLILNSVDVVNSNDIIDSLVINCPEDDFMASWIKKLAVIFPLERPNSPSSASFFIKLQNESDVKMNGLGIDTLSDDPESEPEESEPERSPFRELISSPSLTSQTMAAPSISVTSNQLSPQSITGLQQPRRPMGGNSSRTSSFSSTNGSFKTVGSDASSFKNGSRATSSPRKPFTNKTDNLQVHTINKAIPIHEDNGQERPHSSSASVEQSDEDKENISPAIQKPQPVKVASTKNNHPPQNSIYNLSSGSNVDISNFGKNHNPSFSIPKGLNEYVEPKPKPKLFGLFKRSSKSKVAPAKQPQQQKPQQQQQPQQPQQPQPQQKPRKNMNNKNLTITTEKTPVSGPSSAISSDSDTIPMSANSGTSTVTQGTQHSITQHKNNSGTAFALPSSTSTYFFKPKRKDAEEPLSIPRDLKDTINDDESIDFYMSPSEPKSMKVSKWKAKYGKWEMLTVNETLFVKLVVNYQLQKGWFIVFKEEYDEEYKEMVDVPVILLDIKEDSDITKSSALDVQLFSKNAITDENMLLMVRCNTNELTDAILNNVKNVRAVLAPKKLGHKSSQRTMGDSKQTIVSSVMDGGASKSSTLTSVSAASLDKADNKVMTRDNSYASISSEDINNASILSNPNNSKFLVLSDMMVRLQKQLESYDSITNPSSWQILSMFNLNVYLISDDFSKKDYYNFVVENDDPKVEDFNWLISDDDVKERVEQIGKAGLLIKVSDDDLFMIECKGKKEFKQLSDVF